MLFGKVTREFDHLQYLPVIQRMYDTSSLEEIQHYASFSQVERFRQELDTLESFGLHKQLEVKVDRTQDDPSASRKFSDGKVDTLFSVSNANPIKNCCFFSAPRAARMSCVFSNSMTKFSAAFFIF